MEKKKKKQKKKQQGHSIVIDDENFSRQTRESIVKKAKAGFPQCETIAIVFEPKGLCLQSQFAFEFSMAECDKESSTSFRQSSHDSFLSRNFVPPSKDEGFDRIIEHHESRLVVRKPESCFVNEALLVQLSALLEYHKDKQQLSLRSGSRVIFQRWVGSDQVRKFENRRVIFLVDGENVCILLGISMEEYA